MFSKFCAAACAALLLASCGVEDTADSDASLNEALASVDGERLRAHIAFLADDVLEGRETGTRGYELAAKYVATQYRLLGLKPGGTDGSFLQDVPLRASRLAEGTASMTIVNDDGSTPLVWKDDFVMGGGALNRVDEVEAPLVFVGYGITAPEYDYDDYEGIDVAGKIVVVLSGAPPVFPTDQRAFYSKGKDKRANAHGAVGFISFRTLIDQKRSKWERVTLNAGKNVGMSWLQADGTPFGSYANMKGSALLSAAGAAKLFKGTDQTVDEVYAKAEASEVNSFDLSFRARLARASVLDDVTSPNVVAVLEGSDPVLRYEYVVVTAHLDHIGIRKSKTDDTIYNGAYDNATGTALLIETARALASMPDRAKRSIIFAAVTGEEKGLLGAGYFASNPTVPIDKIVANINLDMPLFMAPASDVIAFGAEHSSLAAFVAAAAGAEGLSLSPDPWPEQVIFVRSDHYRFVEAGVPAVFLWPGLGSADPDIDTTALKEDFMANTYHKPSDDMDVPFLNGEAERFARINMRIALDIANADSAPTWNAGDFFGTKFGPDRMAPDHMENAPSP